MTCVLGLIMFLLYSNRVNDDDEDSIPSESTLEEGQSRVAEPQGEASEAAAAASATAVEIAVPSTPMITTMSDVSDNSAVSSLSESPFTTGAKSPLFDVASPTTQATPCLGITKSRYRYGGENTLGFAAEKWQPRNWEIYKDDSTVESL